MIKKPYKIYCKNPEPGVLDQFYSALELESVVQGALMADAHLGYTLPIGAVIATEGIVFPSWVGYDIGCGMCALKTNIIRIDVIPHMHEIFNTIYEGIPVGFNINKTANMETWDLLLKKTAKINKSTALQRIIKEKKAPQALGSLGSGNHFIEIGYDSKDYIWIIIHSGSRGLGHGLATHYMKLASGDGKAREGHFGHEVNSWHGQDYLNDLEFGLEFALANREEMMQRVLNILTYVIYRNIAPYQLTSTDYTWLEKQGEFINRNHNHIEERNGLYIHRKGATHAESGMRGVVPGNMYDGSFIVEGLGNPESLYSSSHGAGRILSRRAAKEKLDYDQFVAEMQEAGITCCTKRSILDESRGAYKNIFEVMDAQKDLVKIVDHIKPLINIKGYN